MGEDPRRRSAELSKERYAAVTEVRRILAQHWLDTDLLRVTAAGAVVTIQGRPEKRYAQMQAEGMSANADADFFRPVHARFLVELDLAVRAVKGVHEVKWNLEGWLHAGSEWLAVG